MILVRVRIEREHNASLGTFIRKLDSSCSCRFSVRHVEVVDDDSRNQRMDDKSYKFPKSHLQVQSEKYTSSKKMMRPTTPNLFELRIHVSDKREIRRKKKVTSRKIIAKKCM